MTGYLSKLMAKLLTVAAVALFALAIVACDDDGTASPTRQPDREPDCQPDHQRREPDRHTGAHGFLRRPWPSAGPSRWAWPRSPW